MQIVIVECHAAVAACSTYDELLLCVCHMFENIAQEPVLQPALQIVYHMRPLTCDCIECQDCLEQSAAMG